MKDSTIYSANSRFALRGTGERSEAINRLNYEIGSYAQRYARLVSHDGFQARIRYFSPVGPYCWEGVRLGPNVRDRRHPSRDKLLSVLF